jgi:tRNA A37 methylthiotransferase MiaB
MDIQSTVSEQFHKSLVGREFDMIVDSSDPETGSAVGRTYMDAPDVDCTVSVDCGIPDDQAFCRIRIVETGPYDIIGEAIKNTVEHEIVE